MYGHNAPEEIETFEEVEDKVKAFLLKSIRKEAGYARPSPIQRAVLPVMLSDRDVLACAPTGSGKTAAFVIPVLAKIYSNAVQRFLKRKKKAIREGKAGGISCVPLAIVLAPTRELTSQIVSEFVKLGDRKRVKVAEGHKIRLGGPAPVGAYDVVVATPKRGHTFLTHPQVDPAYVQWFVVDEVDRIFDYSFIEQLDAVLTVLQESAAARDDVPHLKMSRAFFSATVPQQVEDLTGAVLRDEIRVVVGAKMAAAASVSQELVFVGRESGKLLALRQIVARGILPPVLIFVQSRARADQLYKEMVYMDLKVDVIHSAQTTPQREEIVRDFRRGKIWFLITTELMGRGMDFKGVSVVVNYDFPSSVVEYIHRVGRTGRGGRTGRAITLFTEVDKPALRPIARVAAEAGNDVPDWMLSLAKPTRATVKALKTHPRTRESIDSTSLDPVVSYDDKQRRLKARAKRKKMFQRLEKQRASQKKAKGKGKGKGKGKQRG